MEGKDTQDTQDTVCVGDDMARNTALQRFLRVLRGLKCLKSRRILVFIRVRRETTATDTYEPSNKIALLYVFSKLCCNKLATHTANDNKLFPLHGTL